MEALGLPSFFSHVKKSRKPFPAFEVYEKIIPYF